jgi:hypothetical protein
MLHAHVFQKKKRFERRKKNIQCFATPPPPPSNSPVSPRRTARLALNSILARIALIRSVASGVSQGQIRTHVYSPILLTNFAVVAIYLINVIQVITKHLSLYLFAYYPPYLYSAVSLVSSANLIAVSSNGSLDSWLSRQVRELFYSEIAPWLKEGRSGCV